MRNRNENSMKVPHISKTDTFSFKKLAIHAPMTLTAVYIF